MGGFIGGGGSAPAMPAPDTSALDETKKQRAEEKAKNEARLRNRKAQGGGNYGLLQWLDPNATTQAKLGG